MMTGETRNGRSIRESDERRSDAEDRVQRDGDHGHQKRQLQRALRRRGGHPRPRDRPPVLEGLDEDDDDRDEQEEREIDQRDDAQADAAAGATHDEPPGAG